VPALLVPDNTKVAVIKACLHRKPLRRHPGPPSQSQKAGPYRSQKRPRHPGRHHPGMVGEIIYAVETAIRGQTAAERQGTRQSQSRQLVAAMKAWLEQQLRQIPPRGGLADAIRCSRLLDLRLVPQRVPRLFTDLALARGDGRHPRLLRALGRVDLLILDDWGLEPLDAAARHDLLEILEDRYGRRSTTVTSQLPVDQWHALIGNPTYADCRPRPPGP
jgi:hypothetical protein